VAEAGADFIHVVNDVAFNAGRFISPPRFSEFIAPCLKAQVQHIKARGMIPFVHTDGNIMPILDDYLSLGAACFQPVDPMTGMDIAEVKRRCHGRPAVMGSVRCRISQEGPREAIHKSVLYCLEHASPGGDCVFAPSNTVFSRTPLQEYEYVLSVCRGRRG